jgi:hypothetical protein
MNQVRYGDEVPEIFHPTMKLRIVRRLVPVSGYENVVQPVDVLQQAWRNVSSNELEYRDIEVVESSDGRFDAE